MPHLRLTPKAKEEFEQAMTLFENSYLKKTSNRFDRVVEHIEALHKDYNKYIAVFFAPPVFDQVMVFNNEYYPYRKELAEIKNLHANIKAYEKIDCYMHAFNQLKSDMPFDRAFGETMLNKCHEHKTHFDDDLQTMEAELRQSIEVTGKILENTTHTEL